jgi:hypothetical protein
MRLSRLSHTIPRPAENGPTGASDRHSRGQPRPATRRLPWQREGSVPRSASRGVTLGIGKSRIRNVGLEMD